MLLVVISSHSQDGRFHNAFKWHITEMPPRTAKNNFVVSQSRADGFTLYLFTLNSLSLKAPLVSCNQILVNHF